MANILRQTRHLVALFGLATAVGCTAEYSAQEPQFEMDPENQGLLQLRLQDVAASIALIDMSIARADGSIVMAGELPVSPGSNSAFAALALPAGLGYTVNLTADSPTMGTCQGSSVFNVVPGRATGVALTLRCTPEDAGNNNGDVNIDVVIESNEPNECPDISFISAFPRSIRVGESLALSAGATKTPATYAWTASSGTFADASQPNTEFTCTQPGPAQVTLAVTSDPNCEDSHQINIDCQPTDAPDPDADNPDAPDDSPDDSQGETQELTLRFAPKVGSEPFECGRTYTNLGSTGAEGSAGDFRFFVHRVRLLKADGSEVEMALTDRPEWQWSGVALIDFENGPEGGCFGGTAEQNDVITGTAPAGDYTGVRFEIGLPGPLSHADPSTLQAPLTAGGMAWNWLAGFKFLKFELGSGTFHVGSTACSGTPPDSVNCARPNRAQIELLDFDPTAQQITTDLAAAFAGSDLSQSPNCHSTGDACAPLFETLGIDLESGSAGGVQSIFSVQ